MRVPVVVCASGEGGSRKKKKREAHAGRARLAPVGGRVMPA